MRDSAWCVPYLCMAAVLVACVCVAGFRWHDKRSSALAATRNLHACRQLERQINVLREAPRNASLQVQSFQDLAVKIELAAQVAEIPESSIVSITPQQGRRVGESSHVEHPTDLELRGVSLKQLALFLRELSSDECGLHATMVRVSAPRTGGTEEGDEIWAIEMVLTYLLFSPK